MSNGFRFRQTSRATGFRAWLEEMDGDVTDLADDAFDGSNAFRRTGVKAVMVAVQKPGWQVSDQADHSTSKAGHSTHPGQPAGQESQVAQDGPQTSPAASNAQQETSTETPSVSASKTAVPTHPAEKQDSEPQAESNAARTNPSGSNNRRNGTKNAATATHPASTARPRSAKPTSTCSSSRAAVPPAATYCIGYGGA
jgi:hypothetical protein